MYLQYRNCIVIFQFTLDRDQCSQIFFSSSNDEKSVGSCLYIFMESTSYRLNIFIWIENIYFYYYSTDKFHQETPFCLQTNHPQKTLTNDVMEIP